MSILLIILLIFHLAALIHAAAHDQLSWINLTGALLLIAVLATGA